MDMCTRKSHIQLSILALCGWHGYCAWSIWLWQIWSSPTCSRLARFVAIWPTQRSCWRPSELSWARLHNVVHCGRPHQHFARQSINIHLYSPSNGNGLSCGIRMWAQLSFVYVTMHAFDRQTDGQTDRILIAPRLHSMKRGKNCNWQSIERTLKHDSNIVVCGYRSDLSTTKNSTVNLNRI